MLIKSLIISAAASGLLASAAPISAMAQQTSNPLPTSPLPEKGVNGLPKAEAPAATDEAVEISATELSVFNKPESPYVTDHVSGPTANDDLIVSSGPVPDTAENRAKYRPLSGAGRRSSSTGR